jgi:hypothetical protein
MNERKKSLSWLWYIVLIVVLGIGAAFITGYFNTRQQMKRADIESAIQRWDRARIKNYSMKYTQRIRSQPDEIFEVTVREGIVTRVLRNDLPLPADKLASFSMGNKLAEIEQFYNVDESAKKRVYMRGYFDANNGRLLSYTRRVMGTDERLSISVQEFREE